MVWFLTTAGFLLCTLLITLVLQCWFGVVLFPQCFISLLMILKSIFTGKTRRDRVEREVGGRIGMGNTYISMDDSCQCMTKTTTIL